MNHSGLHVTRFPTVVVGLGSIWMLFLPLCAAQTTSLETIKAPSNQGVLSKKGPATQLGASAVPAEKRLIRYYDEKGHKHYVNYDTFVPEQFRASAEYDVSLPPITRGVNAAAQPQTVPSTSNTEAGVHPNEVAPAPPPVHPNPAQSGTVRRGGDGVIAKPPPQNSQPEQQLPGEVADVFATASAIKQKEGIDPMDPKFIQDTLLEASRALGYQP